jgi:undecaprenyl-diphosphatase
MAPIVAKVRALLTGKEPLVLVAVLLVVAAVWALVKLTGEVREGETVQFDTRVTKALRRPDDPSKLRGPKWVESAVRDVTALGGVVVLTMVTVGVVLFLIMIRRYHMMWVVLIATCGAAAINSSIKVFIGRARPTIVPRLTDVSSESFPSGHSALSAAVYLTLGSLLAQSVPSRPVKYYFIGVALLLAFMVGVSRVALGVHYPSDVLAGWATGLCWALLCWLFARYLQKRGAVEQADQPLPDQLPGQ